MKKAHHLSQNRCQGALKRCGKGDWKNISRLKGFEPTADFVEHIMQKRLYVNIADTQYTDDSKVTDHYAIIPTGQLTELSGLTSLQRAVFELIVRRFLSIFIHRQSMRM